MEPHEINFHQHFWSPWERRNQRWNAFQFSTEKSSQKENFRRERDSRPTLIPEGFHLLQLSGLGFLRWSRVDIFLKIWCSSEKYKAAGFLKLCTTADRSRPWFWTENGWERTRERLRTRTRKRGKEKHLCEYFLFFSPPCQLFKRNEADVQHLFR